MVNKSYKRGFGLSRNFSVKTEQSSNQRLPYKLVDINYSQERIWPCLEDGLIMTMLRDTPQPSYYLLIRGREGLDAPQFMNERASKF